MPIKHPAGRRTCLDVDHSGYSDIPYTSDGAAASAAVAGGAVTVTQTGGA
jgi:hypothetical protein